MGRINSERGSQGRTSQREISPGYSLEGLMLNWNSNTLAIWCEELTHVKRPWCWERLKAGGEGDDRGRDGWMASPTQWTWVWVDSGGCWWTGRPGVLQSMGLQRVGHDWATELNWTQRPNSETAFQWKNFKTLLGGLDGKESASNAGDRGPIPGWGRSPGEETATHSGFLAWRIPRTEEPGGLQFTLRVAKSWTRLSD